MVIAGTPEEPDSAQDRPAIVDRGPAVGDEARTAAAHLLAARGRSSSVRGHSPEPSRRRAEGAVLVSTLRASQALASGRVVALRCTARTDDGDLVATRIVLLHAGCEVVRPRTRGEARAIAAAAVAALPDLRGTPDFAAWSAAVTRRHEASIDRRRARERALHDRQAERAPVQPGLFDRRALRAAAEWSDNERAIHAEHRRRIDALERARRPHFSCTPIAVLIVWR